MSESLSRKSEEYYSDSTIMDWNSCNAESNHLDCKPSTSTGYSALEDTKPPLTFGHLFRSDSNPELDSILKKYSSVLTTTTTSTSSSKISDACIELSSDDDDLPRISQSASKQTFTDSQTYLLNKYSFSDNEKFGNPISQIPTHDNLCQPSTRKRKSNAVDKENNEIAKAKKREETERAKALKKAQKNIKPEECMKFVTVFLDDDILNAKYSGEILNALQSADITYQVRSQIIPNTITWSRKNFTHSIEDHKQVLKLSQSSDIVETEEVLLIMDWKEVIEFVADKRLLTHIKSLQSILCNKKLSLLLHGIENYFRYQKNKKQKILRSKITTSPLQKSNKSDIAYGDVADVTKKQFDVALTELQLLCSCSYRTTNSPNDLGLVIAQFTKAIAQKPYKLEKYERLKEADWYMPGDNKDCVQVDKNGNGLQRLWQQMLTMFPMVRLEQAEAIVGRYSTPLCLINVYNQSTPDAGAKLLEDIPIRRAAGPLTTVRKIGPELSKKIHRFFTSTDGKVSFL